MRVPTQREFKQISQGHRTRRLDELASDCVLSKPLPYLCSDIAQRRQGCLTEDFTKDVRFEQCREEGWVYQGHQEKKDTAVGSLVPHPVFLSNCEVWESMEKMGIPWVARDWLSRSEIPVSISSALVHDSFRNSSLIAFLCNRNWFKGVHKITLKIKLLFLFSWTWKRNPTALLALGSHFTTMKRTSINPMVMVLIWVALS